MKKKIIAMFLTLAVVIAMFPVIALADGEVAQIGTTKYESLQAALNAATGGDTIELLTDVDLGSTNLVVPANIAVTIDGNEKTISFSGASAFKTNNGSTSITVRDTKFNGSVKARYVVITGSNYSGSVSFNNCEFNDLIKCAVIMDPNGEQEAKLSITNCRYENTPLGYSINMVGKESQKLNIAVTFTGNEGFDLEFEVWKEAVVIDSNSKFVHQYDLADVMATTQSGDTVKLLKDSDTDIVLPEGVTFDTNGKTYGGTVRNTNGDVIKDNNGVYKVETESEDVPETADGSNGLIWVISALAALALIGTGYTVLKIKNNI